MDSKSTKRTNYNTKLVKPLHYLGIYFLITNLDPFIFFSTLILIFGIGDFFAIIQILIYLAPPIIGIHTIFFIFQTLKFSKHLKSILNFQSVIIYFAIVDTKFSIDLIKFRNEAS